MKQQQKLNGIIYGFWVSFLWALFHIGAVIWNGIAAETVGFWDWLQHLLCLTVIAVFLVFARITYLQNK